MTLGMDSQNLESYVPVYDVIPEKWENARPFIVEQLKKITNSLNTKEIGFFLDQELLSGKSFVPGVNQLAGGGSSQQFRTVLRIVVNVAPLVIGANTFPHEITFDANFTLVDLWVAATNSSTLVAEVITDGNVNLSATNINITSPGAFDRAWCVIEYLQET
jgi:hypothetical protein